MNNTFPPKFTEEKREATFIIGALQRMGGRIYAHRCIGGWEEKSS